MNCYIPSLMLKELFPLQFASELITNTSIVYLSGLSPSMGMTSTPVLPVTVNPFLGSPSPDNVTAES